MTSILLAVAARCVASTSNLFLDAGGTGSSPGHRGGSPESLPVHKTVASSGEGARPAPQRGPHTRPTAREPRIVILDLEQGMHAARVLLSVRKAVLRRWEEAAAAWEWKKERDAPAQLDGAAAAAAACGDTPANTGDEQRRIKRALMSCLGRNPVIRTRDFTYLDLVVTIEVVMHGLDREKASRTPPVRNKEGTAPKFGRSDERGAAPPSAAPQRQEPPTLILIDALTTLGGLTRFQESLPAASRSTRSSGNSGLSDRNEFNRQLLRLREEHDIVIVGAARSVPSDHNRTDGPASRGQTGRHWSGNSLWDKMVSRRISLHRAAEGTSEDHFILTHETG